MVNTGRLKRRIIEFLRKPLRKKYSDSVISKEFTIFSSNCIGGTMYHDAMAKFLSPTINLTIPDFLSFVENFDRFINADITFLSTNDSNRHFDFLLNNKLLVKMYHSISMDEALDNWIKRRERITSNIFIVATDEFVRSDLDKKRFDKLPYPKVCFVSRSPEYDWEIYLPEFKKTGVVQDATRICFLSLKRIYQQHFNYIKWINDGFAKYYSDK